MDSPTSAEIIAGMEDEGPGREDRVDSPVGWTPGCGRTWPGEDMWGGRHGTPPGPARAAPDPSLITPSAGGRRSFA